MGKLTLFHWSAAKCLARHSAGDIIVMAEALDKARELARGEMLTWLRADKEWWWDSDGQINSDYLKDYDRFRHQLEIDLAAEPEIVETGVVFIRGSS